jgi:hypothetical protein
MESQQALEEAGCLVSNQSCHCVHLFNGEYHLAQIVEREVAIDYWDLGLLRLSVHLVSSILMEFKLVLEVFMLEVVVDLYKLLFVCLNDHVRATLHRLLPHVIFLEECILLNLEQSGAIRDVLELEV